MSHPTYLYSFNLREFESGRLHATRFPSNMAVSGDWVILASSDKGALAAAHRAAENEWGAPRSRGVHDFTVRFTAAHALRRKNPKIREWIDLPPKSVYPCKRTKRANKYRGRVVTLNGQRYKVEACATPLPLTDAIVATYGLTWGGAKEGAWKLRNRKTAKVKYARKSTVGRAIRRVAGRRAKR